MTIKLKPTTETAEEQHKRMYGKNWEYHYNQWKLYNTKAGKQQRDKYVKFINGGK